NARRRCRRPRKCGCPLRTPRFPPEARQARPRGRAGPSARRNLRAGRAWKQKSTSLTLHSPGNGKFVYAVGEAVVLEGNLVERHGKAQRRDATQQRVEHDLKL